jgi:hypothetical protein
MPRPIKTDKWPECLDCQYCVDDDGALYCDLGKCVKEEVTAGGSPPN